ncbi:hypothetical protein Tco_1138716 [Tanacetum coccineum]
MDEPQGPHIRILIIFKVSLLLVNRIPSLIGSADSHQITALDDGVMKQDGANVQFMKEEGRGVNIFKDETVIQFLNKAFRFVNYIAEKSEFLDIMKEWKFEVVKLKDALKQAQRDVDAFTLNLQVKIKETFCLKEYQEAVDDEEKLMFQQANVNWLLRMANQLRELKKLNNSLIIILGHSSKCFLIDDIATLFTNKVTSDKAEYIIRDVYDNEIKEVVFDIRDCKSPGLDGKLLGESSFIPGRNIHDNILLAHELLRRYNKKSGAKRLAMKIDIAKAYDTVDWKVKECKDFKYPLRCKDLSLTHMCFVDDLLVICHGDVKYVKLPVRYLGVPLLTKDMGVNDCKNLVDRIKTRVNDWKNKSLSYAGRL